LHLPPPERDITCLLLSLETLEQIPNCHASCGSADFNAPHRRILSVFTLPSVPSPRVNVHVGAMLIDLHHLLIERGLSMTITSAGLLPATAKERLFREPFTIILPVSCETIRSIDPGLGTAVKSPMPFERLLAAPVKVPRELARLILMQAEQFRRLARGTDDMVVHDELIALAGRCDVAAATMLSHAGGHADNYTSHLRQK
jgi:hypothetical protein